MTLYDYNVLFQDTGVTTCYLPLDDTNWEENLTEHELSMDYLDENIYLIEETNIDIFIRGLLELLRDEFRVDEQLLTHLHPHAYLRNREIRNNHNYSYLHYARRVTSRVAREARRDSR